MSKKLSDEEAGVRHPRGIDINSENFPFYKPGCNYREEVKIKQCYEAGYDQFQTCHAMGLLPTVVKNLWPQKMGKPRNNAAA